MFLKCAHCFYWQIRMLFVRKRTIRQAARGRWGRSGMRSPPIRMSVQFSHPYYLLLLAPALAWVIWFAWKSDVQVSPWRRWTALAIRTVVLTALVFAIAGLQWRRPMEGMNVFFALDRSDSIPSPQQDAANNTSQSLPAEKEGG